MTECTSSIGQTVAVAIMAAFCVGVVLARVWADHKACQHPDEADPQGGQKGKQP